MKRTIAKSLAMVVALSAVIVTSPLNTFVDVVSAATGETSTTTTTTTTTTKAPTPTVPGQTYTVVKGDVMWKIAAKFGLTLDELKALNPQIKNFNLIRVGQKVTVAKAAATTTATTPVTQVVTANKVYHGFGEAADYRLGHTSLNITSASVVFDENGKILDLKWDVQEISPTLFPGWIDEKGSKSTEEQAAFKANIDDKWLTKSEEKDEYGMKASAISGKEWYEQMNFYQSFFKGMTVAQVEAWAAKYCDPKTMRPWKLAYINSDKLKDADKAAINAATANFTAEEKKMLVDVTTSATMSLQDDHSHFMTALKEAYANKTEVK